MDEYIKNWTRDKNGIYHSRFPKDLSLIFLINDMTVVQRDYTSNGNTKIIAVKTVIDASNVSSCPESVLTALNHAISEFPNTRTAIYNESTVFKEISDKYYSSNKMASALNRFTTEQEALDWVKK